MVDESGGSVNASVVGKKEPADTGCLIEGVPGDLESMGTQWGGRQHDHHEG